MGWMFEVAKMFLYVSFPVGIFYYANRPAYYEEWVIKAKEEYFPRESRQVQEQMENLIQDINAATDRKHLDALERQRKNKQ